MKTRQKRAVCLALAGALALSLAGCGQKTSSFDDFIRQEFIDSMESDYTSAYILMQDPAGFGVDKEAIQVGWGSRFDEQTISEAKQETLRTMEAFGAFERETLDEYQQETYDIYAYQGERALALNEDKFDYYPSLFESMSGLHYQIPTTLADWELRQESDIPDLITLVKDTRPYLQSAIEYTRRQQEKGLLMLDIPSITEYCDGILASGADSTVLSGMCGSIDALGLPADKAEGYKQELTEAFTGSFLPAYQELRDAMEQLSQGQNNEEGLAAFPEGREYYEWLLRQNCGSDKTVEEIRALMEESLSRHVENMQTILLENAESFNSQRKQGDERTGYTSYAQMLDDLSEWIQADFPAVGDLEYEIRDIDEEIASSSGVAAYFNVPALDGKEVKQLRVNPLTADLTSVETFCTVAHEGFPGHMYQFAYMYENVDSPYRKALVNELAYTEGWAVYAETQAEKYLDGLDQGLLALNRENELAIYCVLILADIGIHYEGWNKDQVGNFFSRSGMSSFGREPYLTELYLQLQANPCAFEPYYVGYEEIAALRRTAEEALGDSFDEKSFHEAFLESGTAPFFVVERHINEYMVAAQGGQDRAA